jgi:hypothetical protein
VIVVVVNPMGELLDNAEAVVVIDGVEGEV